MTPFTLIVSFVFGTIIGSFLSVVIYRDHKKMKMNMRSRSICPHCKEKIHPKYLIPIVSYMLIGGKCAYCKKKISPHYFFIEVVSGLTMAITFATWTFIQVKPELNFMLIPFLNFAFYATIFSFLIAIFFYDLSYKLIPDKFSLPAIAIATIGGLLLKTVTPLSMLAGGVGIFLFFAVQFYASKGRWVGGGDLRLGALIGVLLGWKLGLVALLMAYLIGSIVSLPLLLLKKVGRKTQIPFGPFLISGVFIAIFLGDKLVNWYMSTLTIY